MRIKLVLSFAVALVLAQAAAATINGGAPPPVDVNKDLTNLGPAAHDLAIVLQGTQTMTRYFNGHRQGSKIGWFSSPSISTVGGNTVIHWQAFWDGSDDRIDTNQTIHVGFSTASGNRNILDFYWTNEEGRRIPGSIVYDVYANATYRTDRLTWLWVNDTAMVPISVTNVRYAIRSQPFSLDQLSSENAELENALVPLADSFVLDPGEQQAFEVPGFVPPESAVVVAYETSAPGSGAVVVTYLQTLAR